jgi:hypothetical protein
VRFTRCAGLLDVIQRECERSRGLHNLCNSKCTNLLTSSAVRVDVKVGANCAAFGVSTHSKEYIMKLSIKASLALLALGIASQGCAVESTDAEADPDEQDIQGASAVKRPS